MTFDRPSKIPVESVVRRDIQALRALAVGSVAAYHAGLPVFNSGFVGVDIFFVISGYLIIGLLVREQQKNGRIDLLNFVGRRARRLIPASSLVLLTTILFIWLMLPGLAGQRALDDVRSAAFYFANIDFAITGMDYWATQTVGPVVHFWSLGVEEQFYIFFPILLVLVFAVVKRNLVTTVTAVLLVVTAASFWLMIFYLDTGSLWAFYGPQSRAWEFAIGGIAATFGANRHFKQVKLRRILLWLGWTALLYSVVAIDPKADFPSPITTLPVLAVALVLWLGSASDSDDPILHKFYSFSFIQRLGDLSYSTYLWHWPVLYFGARYVQQPFQGPERLTAIWAVPLMLLSIGLAAATYKWIENPFRHAAFIKYSGLKSIFFGLTLSLAVAVIAALASTQVMRQQAGDSGPEVVAAEIANVKNSPEVTKIIDELAPKYSTSDDLAVSASQVIAAQDDMTETYSSGCHGNGRKKQTTLPENCTFGPSDSKSSIFLFGNSHANMFFTPIRDAALAQGAKLTSRTFSACSISDVTTLVGKSEYVACNSWRDLVMAEITSEIPQLVIISSSPNLILDPTTGTQATPERSNELYIAGLQRIVQQLTDLGIKVIMIRDTPRLRESPLDCLSKQLPPSCKYSVTDSVYDPALSVSAVDEIPRVLPVDLTLALCGTSRCESVRSGTIVWRDSHHITDTYAKLLTPLFAKLIALEIPTVQ
jgi:peptidoglycan/LPS O-acetylase OafA/YrhL